MGGNPVAGRLGRRAAKGAVISLAGFLGWIGEMDLDPPAGSRISVVHEGGEPTIVIPIPVATGPAHYFFGLFMVIWLFGAAFLLLRVASEVLAGNGNALLVFVLGGLTLGVVFAAHAVYRAQRARYQKLLNWDEMALATTPALFRCC